MFVIFASTWIIYYHLLTYQGTEDTIREHGWQLSVIKDSYNISLIDLNLRLLAYKNDEAYQDLDFTVEIDKK